MVVRYPLNFNHPLDRGINIAGIVMRNVTKMKIAFAMAAIACQPIYRAHLRHHIPFSGHVSNSRSRATFSRVGVSLASTFVVNAKTSMRAPDPTNNRSAARYWRRILLFDIVIEV